MPNFFLTFRAHPSEPQVFEDFNLLFQATIQKKSRYAWSIEWDDTPQRHIHCLLCDVSDISKIIQLWNTKHYLLFKKHLDTKNTNWLSDEDNKGFYNCVRVDDKNPEMSTKYYLGYVNKHNNRRRDQVNFTQQEITDAVKEYHAIQRISARPEKNNNIKLITSKNIYQNLIAFVENDQNKSSFGDRYLKYQTVKLGHFGYANISDNAESKAFQELRIMYDQENDQDKQDCNQKSLTQKDKIDIYYHNEKMKQKTEEIEFLLSILENNKVELNSREQYEIKNIIYNNR